MYRYRYTFKLNYNSDICKWPISDRNLVEHVPNELIVPKIKVFVLESIGDDNNNNKINGGDNAVIQCKESGSEKQ